MVQCGKCCEDQKGRILHTYDVHPMHFQLCSDCNKKFRNLVASFFEDWDLSDDEDTDYE